MKRSLNEITESLWKLFIPETEEERRSRLEDIERNAHCSFDDCSEAEVQK